MSKIRIITDSTAYLTEELAAQLEVIAVPLVVNFQGESYAEGSLYTNEEFFRLVDQAPTLPTTSQPPAGEFVEVYKKLFAEGAEDIIGIFISAELSGTYSSAQTGLEILGSDRVHLVDSRFTVAPMRFMVEEAVAMAKRGQSVAEILAALEGIKERMNLFFVVQTLEHLRKGGRIGGAATLLGTLLNVKPILYLTNGKIDVFDKVRTKPKAWARVCEELDKAIATGKAQRVSVVHVASPEEAKILAEDLRKNYPGQSIEISEMGQVIGTHVGRGAVGLAFYEI